MAMAKPHENTPEARVQQGFDGYEEPPAATTGCFRRLCFGWDDFESHNYLLQERDQGLHKESTPSWVVDQFKKVKEFSELVAGPKWKNFVRKIGRFCNPRKYTKTTQFQYSPEGHALNFDGDGELEEDGGLMHSFSTRFALINDPQRRGGVLS